MFAGSHGGAQKAAMFYSFFGTCKMNDVDPFTWFKTVLEIILFGQQFNAGMIGVVLFQCCEAFIACEN